MMRQQHDNGAQRSWNNKLKQLGHLSVYPTAKRGNKKKNHITCRHCYTAVPQELNLNRCPNCNRQLPQK